MLLIVPCCCALQVAVFDTAYHQTMPASSYMYALPYELFEKHAIRKYGFHGTSHRYLVQQASKLLGKPESQLNLIICHIGERGNHMLLPTGTQPNPTCFRLVPVGYPAQLHLLHTVAVLMLSSSLMTTAYALGAGICRSCWYS